MKTAIILRSMELKAASKKSLFLIAACAAMSTFLVAQAPTTLRVNVRLVNVVATVTDAAGRFVPDLKAEDFTVLEDGASQKISHFTQDRDIPVSVGILLDTSGSMDRKIRTASSAVVRFINSVHEDDDIFVMTFDRNVDLQQDFTSDRRKLTRVLDALRLGGGTRLFDAVREGLEKVHKGRHDKRAILVISDGQDYGSRTRVPDLVRTIRSSEVLVYGLGTSEATYADPDEHVPFALPTPQGRGPAPVVNSRGRRNTVNAAMSGVNMPILTQFAENSGGKAFLLSETFINDGPSEIETILTLIAEELRSQYTLGYYPASPDDGQVHTIQVTNRAGHNVRARTSYLAK